MVAGKQFLFVCGWGNAGYWERTHDQGQIPSHPRFTQTLLTGIWGWYTCFSFADKKKSLAIECLCDILFVESTGDNKHHSYHQEGMKTLHSRCFYLKLQTFGENWDASCRCAAQLWSRELPGLATVIQPRRQLRLPPAKQRPTPPQHPPRQPQRQPQRQPPPPLLRRPQQLWQPQPLRQQRPRPEPRRRQHPQARPLGIIRPFRMTWVERFQWHLVSFRLSTGICYFFAYLHCLWETFVPMGDTNWQLKQVQFTTSPLQPAHAMTTTTHSPEHLEAIDVSKKKQQVNMFILKQVAQSSNQSWLHEPCWVAFLRFFHVLSALHRRWGLV